MVKLMRHRSEMSKYTAEQGQILAAKADTHTCWCNGLADMKAAVAMDPRLGFPGHICGMILSDCVWLLHEVVDGIALSYPITWAIYEMGGEKKADVVPHSSHYPALGGHYKQIVVAPHPHTISCRDSQPLSASMFGYINIRIHIFSSFLGGGVEMIIHIHIHIHRWAPRLIFTSPSMIGSGSDSAVD